MCGIVGVLTDTKNGFSEKEMTLFYENLFINQLRGWDSTGVFAASKDNEAQWFKMVGDLGEFIKQEGWKDPAKGLKNFIWRKGNAVIGHGRSATVGTISSQNAHPFEVVREDQTSIILVHNGTLDRYQTLPDLNAFDVDSHWIADSIVKYGAEESLRQIKGPMALIWYDTQTKKLNFFRNEWRPLHIAFVSKTPNKTKEDYILINSIPEALRWLVDRHKFSYTSKAKDALYFLPEHLYTLPIDNLLGGWERVEKIVPKPIIQVSNTPALTNHNLFPSDDKSNLLSLRRKRHLSGFLSQFDNTDHSFELDALRILNGDYTRIDFYHATKRIMYTLRSGVMEVREDDPYLPGLISMKVSPHSNHVIQSEYQHENYKKTFEYENEFNLLKAVNEDIVENSQPEKVKEARSYIDINHKKFRHNKCIKWHSKRLDNVVIRHEAIVTGNDGPIFSSYKNDDDGLYVKHDELVFELTNIKTIPSSTDNPIKMCFGEPILTNAKSQAVFCLFFDTSEKPDEQLLKGLYRGKISDIRLTTNERADFTKKQVELWITDIKEEERDAA